MIQIASFLFFTGLVGYISWLKTHKEDHASSTGYFLAGRSLGWIVIAGSLLLTNLSTEQLVGLNGGAFNNGMQVMAWEVWSSIAIVLMALVFLPQYLKGGVATVSEFLTRRYSRLVGSIVSILLLLSLVTNLLPFVLYSGAIFMERVFNVSDLLGEGANAETAAIWVNVIALGLVGGIYAIFGGLKAVAVSDTLNGIGLLIGGLLIPVLGLIALGDKLGDGGFFGGLSYLAEHNPEKLNPVGAEHENVPFSTLFTGMLFIVTFYWCTNQVIVQRTFGAKSLAEGQKGVLFAALMKLLGPLYLVLPGIIAWHLFAGQADMKGDDAYAELVIKVLPNWMIGFFAAVIFGAILSSFNSGLNSAATLFSIDVYKGLYNKVATDAQMVHVGKIFGTVVAVLAIAVAPLIGKWEGGLFDLMKNLAALYNIPLIAVVVLGMFHKRITSLSAILAILIGLLFYGYFGIIQKIPGSDFCNLFGAKVHWLHIAGIDFALLAVLMLVVSAIKPRAEPYVQTYSGDVEITPWKWALPAGIALLVLIGLMYYLMSRFGA